MQFIYLGVGRNRGVTAAVNASVQPILDRYLQRLTKEASAAGYPGDILVMNGNGFREVDQEAIKLRNAPGHSPDDLADRIADLDFGNWIRDGAEVAVEHVYRNGAFRSGTRDDGTPLPRGEREYREQ